MSDKGMKRRERRLMAVTVSELAVAQLCLGDGTKEIRLRIKGLPTDAEFLSVDYLPEYRSFFCVFEHPSFPAHYEGQQIVRENIEIEYLGDELVKECSKPLRLLKMN